MAKGKFREWLTDDGLMIIRAWARDGLTDEQIASNCGITPSTLYEWKKRFPEFSEALKRGKEPVDIEVENALLKRALGYSYTEVTKERVANPETGEISVTVTKEVIKEVAPDVGAQAFWLKNRRPDVWRDRKETEISGGLRVEGSTLQDMMSAAGYKKCE